MKKYFCFLLFFNVICVSAQTVKLQLLSKIDNVPIQYASVILLKSKLGMYSDEFGKVEITLPLNDSLSISCIGYETLTVSTKKIKNYTEIFLQPKFFELEETVVKEKKEKFKVYKVGSYWEKQKRYLKPVIGTQWAIRLKNIYQKDGTIDSIFLKFLRGSQTKDSRIMIRLYTVDFGCNCPGREILQQAIVKDIKPHQLAVTINILDKNIKFSNEGLFISLEILGFVDNGVYEPITFGYNVEPVLALSKESSEYDNWIKTPFKKQWEQFFVKNKLMFGATVFY